MKCGICDNTPPPDQAIVMRTDPDPEVRFCWPVCTGVILGQLTAASEGPDETANNLIRAILAGAEIGYDQAAGILDVIREAN